MSGGLRYETGRDMPPGMAEKVAVQLARQLQASASTADPEPAPVAGAVEQRLGEQQMANEKRLIDANALMDEFRRYMAERHDKDRCVSDENCKACDRECLWRRVVNKAPTVNAVEVVRCMVCEKHTDTKEPNVVYCEKFNCFVRAFDFCSYGERREDEK